MRLINNEPEIKCINELAKGTPVNDIADKLEVGTATVYRAKTRNRDLIEALTKEIIEKALPLMIDQDVNELIEANALSKDLIELLKEPSTGIKVKNGDKEDIQELFPKERIAALQKFLERTDKKATDFKRSIGILNSHTPAQVFQTLIYNDNRDQVNQQVMNVLKGTTDWIDEPDSEE